MLKQRILTAVVLVPSVLALLFLAPAWVLVLAVVGVVLLAVFEWSRLLGPRVPAWGRWIWFGATAIGLGAILWAEDQGLAMTEALAVAGAAWWLPVLVLILWNPPRLPGWLSPVAGWFTLLPMTPLLLDLHGHGAALVLFLLMIIWGADVGAYFAGHAFGRHRLAPAVSPGKTWEGVVGGLVVSGGLGLAGAWWFGWSPPATVALALVVAAVSVLGDLSESQFKRHAGVKDSGGILPGHGGVLDRIDSLTSGTPWYYLGLHLVAVPA